MIAKVDIRRVQEWMGHADIQTTMRYLHFAPRDEDAALVAEASPSIEPRTSWEVLGRLGTSCRKSPESDERSTRADLV